MLRGYIIDPQRDSDKYVQVLNCVCNNRVHYCTSANNLEIILSGTHRDPNIYLVAEEACKKAWKGKNY